jgi:hypothetical protein
VTKTKLTGLLGLAVALALAAVNPWPASAASRFDFAYGGGTNAHLMVAAQSQNNGGGTCDIGVHYNLTQQHKELNTIDSVVIDPRARQLNGKIIPVSWGVGQTAPTTTAKLVIRYVEYKPGCPNSTSTYTAHSFNVTIPLWADYVVISTSEGTVQPWVSI